MLPGRDGFSVVEELRKRGVATPILLLTARHQLEDRVRGLEGGADDTSRSLSTFPNSWRASWR